MKKPKHSDVVIRDRRPLGRTIAAGAMAVVLASAMSLPAFAATGVGYYDADGYYQWNDEAFTDEASGVSWDGADAITLNNANVKDLGVVGDATFNFVGESNVAGLIGYDSDLDEGDDDEPLDTETNITLNGDESVPAEQKPILNITNREDGYWAEVVANGNLVIKGLTIIMNGLYNGIGADGNITISNSKVAVADTQKALHIDTEEEGATVDVVDSVVDLGTNGALFANGVLTIDNSDVTSRKGEADMYMSAAATSDEDEKPFMAIGSLTKVVLKNLANGEVKEYTAEYWGRTIYYVTTGDEDGVFLKAASTPGYYLGTAATKASKGTSGMPATGDAVSFGVFAGMAVAAAVAMGISRRRGKHEA